jgi:hypothetical protein
MTTPFGATDDIAGAGALADKMPETLTMRFFRGLTVPAANVDQVLSTIRNRGLSQGSQWSIEYRHPGPLDALFAKPDLSTQDTRPHNQAGDPAVCACSEEMGAAYYAWQHNRTSENDTPIIVEFEADQDAVAIDGRDFLATVFQFGEPALARPALARTCGNAVLSYAERAWATDNQNRRIALCDLARHDPDVVKAHHANTVVLGGRHHTVFRSAFIVKLPTAPQSIIRAWSPIGRPVLPVPGITLSSLLIESYRPKG